MVIVVVLSVVVALAGVAVATYAWWQARKWTILIAYSRVAIEYKGKVKIDAPLREWALWCKQAGKDKQTRGHVMYAMGGTRIALFPGKKPPKVKPVEQHPDKRGVRSRQGTWTDKSKT